MLRDRAWQGVQLLDVFRDLRVEQDREDILRDELSPLLAFGVPPANNPWVRKTAELSNRPQKFAIEANRPPSSAESGTE